MQEGKQEYPEETPAKASLDWKPNGHTAQGPGIESGLSGAQHGGIINWSVTGQDGDIFDPLTDDKLKKYNRSRSLWLLYSVWEMY